jgi:signal transduction histidine kinase
VSGSLVAAGIYMTNGGRARWTGLMVALIGSMWPLDWWAVGSTAGIGALVTWLFAGARWIGAAYVALSYPADLPKGREERNLIWAAAFLFLPGNIVLVLLSRPEWNGFSPNAWWPGLLASRSGYEVISAAYGIGCIVIAACCAIVVARRIKTAVSVDRLILRPSLIGMIFAGLTAAAAKSVQAVVLTESAWKLSALLTGLGMLAVPACLLWSWLRFRIARAGVVETITMLARPATTNNVRIALATALHDETIEVLLWSEDRGELLPGRGQSNQSSAFAGRTVIPVFHSDGSRLAYITTDPRLKIYPEMVQAAVEAARFPLENARMHADLGAALQETRESRSRIYEAQIVERRRLERNLHDGAQQQLLGLAMQLETLRVRTLEPSTEQHIVRIKQDLQAALDEIRDLARGLFPAALEQGGLEAALMKVASALAFETVIDVAAPRLKPTEESAIYYVVCEALSNAAKHAEADHVRISVERSSDNIEVVVTDDGRGGAAMDHAGGLRGMSDRVGALGGRLSLKSPENEGTVIRVEFPAAG